MEHRSTRDQPEIFNWCEALSGMDFSDERACLAMLFTRGCVNRLSGWRFVVFLLCWFTGGMQPVLPIRWLQNWQLRYRFMLIIDAMAMPSLLYHIQLWLLPGGASMELENKRLKSSIISVEDWRHKWLRLNEVITLYINHSSLILVEKQMWILVLSEWKQT